MREQKLIDFLTGFDLRDSLRPFLEHLMLGANRDYKYFSIVLIDVDQFKKYNDKYGHSFGDMVLEHIANILRLTFKEDRCNFFRYGGDEFIIVLINKDPQDTYRSVIDCTLNFKSHPFLYRNKYHIITISCGIANYPTDEVTADGLIKKADKAMYFSKTHGRNFVTLASRIRYLRFRNSLILMLVPLISFMLVFSLYQTEFMAKIGSKIENSKYLNVIPNSIADKVRAFAEKRIKDIKNIPELTGRKIETAPESIDLVAIVLKDGRRLEGSIVKETEDTIELSLDLSVGKIVMNLDKSQIAQIERK
ncbi:MAG: GGDEF domain-containing protein [Candidatus Omnitrophota bacterium]